MTDAREKGRLVDQIVGAVVLIGVGWGANLYLDHLGHDGRAILIPPGLALLVLLMASPLPHRWSIRQPCFVGTPLGTLAGAIGIVGYLVAAVVYSARTSTSVSVLETVCLAVTCSTVLAVARPTLSRTKIGVTVACMLFGSALIVGAAEGLGINNPHGIIFLLLGVGFLLVGVGLLSIDTPPDVAYMTLGIAALMCGVPSLFAGFNLFGGAGVMFGFAVLLDGAMGLLRHRPGYRRILALRSAILRSWSWLTTPPRR